MIKEKKDLSNILYFGTVSIIPILITSLALFLNDMLPGQKQMLVYGDYICEYLPFFRHFWESLLHGKSIEYSFSLGLGTPTMAMYSVFAFSPFSIISYIVKDITLAAYITWMLKISFSAVSMCLFLIKDLKSERKTALLFSFFYSMSSYVMIYYNNIHFMDVLYILPVLMHFLLTFVKENKGLGLTLCYAFCFINNFFNGFCVGVFSFVVYLTLLWYMDIRGERLKNNIIKYFTDVIIATLLSLPVILPAIMYVIQHMPGGSDFSVTPMKSPIYLLNSLLLGRKLRGIFDNMPAIYCGWPTVLLALSFFISKKDRKIKILASVPMIILLICIFWHPAYLFMHLFNEPDSFPWRFSYLLIFALVCIASYEYEHMDRKFFSVAHIIPVLIILIITLSAYYLYRSDLTQSDTIPGYILWINLIFILLHFCGMSKKAILFLVGIPELFCSVLLQLPRTDHRVTFQEDITYDLSQMEKHVESIKNDDQSFFRSSILSLFSSNESFMFDFNGFDYFCSFDNSNLIDAIKILGLQGRPQQYDYNGNTEFTDMIFSVKYIGNADDDVLYTRSPLLPLAFSVSKDIKEIKITEEPFDNQQALADAMTIEDAKLFEPAEIEMITSDSMEVKLDNDKNEYTFKKTGENSWAAWVLKDPDMQPAYMYIFPGAYGTGIFDQDYIVAGDPVTVKSPINLPIINRFVNGVDLEKPTILLSMEGNLGSEVTVNKLISRYIDLDAVQGIYDELSPFGIRIDSYTDNRIHGSVTADDEHTVLFSSIPFDVNWRIKIDGRECETYAVFNGAFLACDITPGTHEVEYIYVDNSVIMGWGAFAIGLFLLLLKYTKSKKNNKADVEAV